MDNNEYKISLGVKLDTSDLQHQVDTAGDRIKPIDIKVDAETKELTNTIKEALKSLSTGTKNVLTLDTSKLEVSLKEVKDAVLDIKNAFGSLGDKSGMQSLLSSVNQIATTIGRVTDETDTLVKSLNALSKKDFNINLGIDMNKKSLNTIGYGRAARKQVIPQLEEQAKYLENLLGGQQSAVSKLAKNRNIGFDIFTDFNDFNSESAIKKMEAMEKYINSLKKLASIENIKLDSFNEQFSKGATELINDITGIENAVDKTGDVPQKLKNIFGSGIDAENLTAQLDSVVKDLGEIKNSLKELSSGASLDGLISSFDKLSNSIELLIKNCGNIKTAINDGISGSNNSIENVDSDLKQVTTTAENATNAIKQTVSEAKKLGDVSIDISDGNVNELKNALKELKIDDASIEDATKELNELNIVAKNVSGTFKNGQLVKWDVKGVQTMENGLERIVTVTKTLGKEGWQSSEKYSQSFDKLAAEAEKVRNKLKDTGFDGFEAEMQRTKAATDKFKESSTSLQEALRLLDNAMEDINSADEIGDAKALVDANEKYENALKQVISQLKLLEQAEKDAFNEQSLTVAKENALLRLKNLFEDNSEAAKRFGAEAQRLKNEINECGDTKGVANLNKQITNLGLEIKKANVQTETFGSKLKKQWEQYKSYLSVASVFMYAEQALRSMFDQVVAIDSAMTELKKVTDETASSYDKFLTNAASKAKEIGTTVDGLVSSTADFARLGFSFEDSQGLAEVANIYAVVGDEIDSVETATQSLISTLTAFKDEANGLSDSDFAMSIVDKMNEVSNNFAISSGGIGEALQRSASSMMAANNSLDETIALITAANTVVQDPDVVGRLMPTLKMAISVKLQRWTRPR